MEPSVRGKKCTFTSILTAKILVYISNQTTKKEENEE